MDQSLTPRGGPAPKKAHFGRQLLEDPNIEQTLLMDTVNVSPKAPKSLNLTPKKFPIVLSSIVETTQNEFNDSLDELTCALKPVTNSIPSTVSIIKAEEPKMQKEESKTENGAKIENEHSISHRDQAAALTRDTSLLPIPEVDVMSSIQEAIELEIEMPSAEQLKDLYDKVAIVEFLATEHMVASMNKEKPNTEEGGVATALMKCARLLIALGKNASKKSFELVQEKDRADFESMLGVEREKAKSMAEERQMLRDRVAEVEAEQKEALERCRELSLENKRLQELAGEADELESELMKCKADNQKLKAQIETKK